MEEIAWPPTGLASHAHGWSTKWIERTGREVLLFMTSVTKQQHWLSQHLNIVRGTRQKPGV